MRRLANERIAIIGAGIGGLAVALALRERGHDIVIVERDPEPPDIDPSDAFDAWQRPGVPQFRHAHILLARVQTLLRDRHPEVHADLLRAGLELSELREVLPAAQRDKITPAREDRDLLHLWGRRATFEYVLRRHTARIPGVRFVHGARVTGLVTERRGEALAVRGLRYALAGAEGVLDADIVIDASGKRSKAPEWLRAEGVRIDTQSKPSGFVYACRHYRLKDPSAAPPRLDGGGNLDFLGYATFYEEHGYFALTFGCPVEEKALAEAMHRAEGFEALCEQLPVLKTWTSLSEPKTKVLGAGLFENRWTIYGAAGGRPLLGLFPVGDSFLETNPMYGRGCSAAFVQAHALADVLAATADPAERLRRYTTEVRRMLTPYYELSVATDRMYHMRARMSRGLPLTLGEKVLNYAYEAAWLPAAQASPVIAKELVKSAQMREISSLGTRLAVIIELFVALLRSIFGRRPRSAAGLERADVLRRLPAHQGGATAAEEA
jgi:2-polyprenyl-6-methoxyphenol hydroxylase-like FAD-dependent oxidoreductase